MWATLAFLTALSLAPHQAGDLKLTNARATYGVLGAARAENKLLPGDVYTVTYDIENLEVAPDGGVLYSMGMELLNSKGKAEFAKEPQDLEARNDLGGTSMPGFAVAEIGTETPPGEYTMKVTVTDRRSKKTATLTQKFEVLPKDFGLVRLFMTYASQTPVEAAPVGVVGQAVVLNCSAIGFQRGKEGDMQPNVHVEMVIQDEQGNPVVKKPFSDDANKDVPAKVAAIPIALPIQLNRAGKFTIKVTAEDRLAKKKASLTVPIRVLELKEK